MTNLVRGGNDIVLVAELAGCFFFSDDDRGRIATRRGDASRLGLAVQLGTVRYLGRFLENPADVPSSVPNLRPAKPSGVPLPASRRSSLVDNAPVASKLIGLGSRLVPVVHAPRLP